MKTTWSGPRDADGRPHGYGEWRDGEESYCGDMVHGVRCGTGVLRGALPGTVYSGEFAAGRFHGSGTWENALTGVKFVGKWHDGARKEGTLTYGTGGKKQKLLSYSGGFINNRREGQGTVRHGVVQVPCKPGFRISFSVSAVARLHPALALYGVLRSQSQQA